MPTAPPLHSDAEIVEALLPPFEEYLNVPACSTCRAPSCVPCRFGTKRHGPAHARRLDAAVAARRRDLARFGRTDLQLVCAACGDHPSVYVRGDDWYRHADGTDDSECVRLFASDLAGYDPDPTLADLLPFTLDAGAFVRPASKRTGWHPVTWEQVLRTRGPRDD